MTESQNVTLKDLGNVHFAVLDHNDVYYSIEETLKYIDMRMIHRKYTYNQGDNG